MDAEIQKQLRAPFPADTVGKLPRVTCRACSDSKAKHCDRHQRAKCQVCGNFISTQHIHLDYIGHAAVTDRLLAVDPSWSWEPVAFGQDGLPALDRNGGLWMRLTVAGATRLGYGHADGKTGADAAKEAIGDSLRNAAMRFGVALDLWHKDGPLVHDEQDTQPRPNGSAPQPEPVSQPDPSPTTVADARGWLAHSSQENGWDLTKVAAFYQERHGESLGAATDPARIEAFRKSLFSVPDAVLKTAATNGAPA